MEENPQVVIVVGVIIGNLIEVKQNEYLKLLFLGWRLSFSAFDFWKDLMTVPNEDTYYIELGKEVLYNKMTFVNRYD